MVATAIVLIWIGIESLSGWRGWFEGWADAVHVKYYLDLRFRATLTSPVLQCLSIIRPFGSQ